MSANYKKEPLSISRDKPTRLSLDYEALRTLGIEWAQRLSGEVWTDYNLHDPGITILENLCFGLLDLAYRSEFPIEDILFARTERYRTDTGQEAQRVTDDQAFHLPEAIFPTHPVTITDYRKLILDQYRQIKNIWIDPIRINEFGLEIKGLYNVYVQLDGALLKADNHTEKEEQELVINQVRQTLHQHRNLCENFLHIKVPQQIEVSIDATLSLAFAAEEALVKAEVFFKIYRFLRNDIRRYSLKELEEEGLRPGQIFDGPLTDYGFIKEEELKKMSFTLIASEVKELILSVEDVIEVSRFQILVNGVSQSGNSITFDADQLPRLNIEDSRINIEIYGLQAHGHAFGTRQRSENRLTQQMVDHHLRLMIAREEKAYYPKREATTLVHKEVLELEELQKYHSIQRLFPQVYGIGDQGPGPYASRKDIAAARQLKSYLLLFEQLMADYLAQLVHIPQLFSVQAGTTYSYFQQQLKDENLPGLSDLFSMEDQARFDKVENGLEAFHQAVETLRADAAGSETFYSRRNQFLDHLLARFGEDFSLEIMEKLARSSEGGPDEDKRKELFERIIDAKRIFLKNYDTISQNRGAAADFPYNLLPGSGNAQVPGAIRKMQKLLLLEPTSYRLSTLSEAPEGIYWVEHLLLYPQQPKKYFIRLLDADGNALLESRESSSLESQQELGRRMLFYGVQVKENNMPGFLEVKQREHGELPFYVQLTWPEIDGDTIVLQTPPDKGFPSREAAEGQYGPRDPDAPEPPDHYHGNLHEIHAYLLDAKAGDLENMNNLFEIAPDKRREDLIPKQGGEFFNQRLSLVLPAWAGRFKGREFQEYAQSIAYDCFPTHIRVDCIWISHPHEMEVFENIYFDWMEAYRASIGHEADLIELDQKAKRLVDQLITRIS